MLPICFVLMLLIHGLTADLSNGTSLLPSTSDLGLDSTFSPLVIPPGHLILDLNEPRTSEKRILGHFTFFWLCVVSAVALLILLACSVACIFDLKNRRHKLPSEGEKSRRHKPKGKDEPNESKNLVGPEDLGSQPADYVTSQTSTGRLKSKRPTLTEKSRLVEQMAIQYSEMSSFSKDQEDKTQEETPPVVKVKSSAYLLDKKKSSNEAAVDQTQRSVSGKTSKRHRHRSSKSKRVRTSLLTTPIGVNATQPEESDSEGSSHSCSCSHPLSERSHSPSIGGAKGVTNKTAKSAKSKHQH